MHHADQVRLVVDSAGNLARRHLHDAVSWIVRISAIAVLGAVDFET